MILFFLLSSCNLLPTAYPLLLQDPALRRSTYPCAMSSICTNSLQPFFFKRPYRVILSRQSEFFPVLFSGPGRQIDDQPVYLYFNMTGQRMIPKCDRQYPLFSALNTKKDGKI